MVENPPISPSDQRPVAIVDVVPAASGPMAEMIPTAFLPELPEPKSKPELPPSTSETEQIQNATPLQVVTEYVQAQKEATQDTLDGRKRGIWKPINTFAHASPEKKGVLKDRLHTMFYRKHENRVEDANNILSQTEYYAKGEEEVRQAAQRAQEAQQKQEAKLEERRQKYIPHLEQDPLLEAAGMVDIPTIKREDLLAQKQAVDNYREEQTKRETAQQEETVKTALATLADKDANSTDKEAAIAQLVAQGDNAQAVGALAQEYWNPYLDEEIRQKIIEGLQQTQTGKNTLGQLQTQHQVLEDKLNILKSEPLYISRIRAGLPLNPDDFAILKMTRTIDSEEPLITLATLDELAEVQANRENILQRIQYLEETTDPNVRDRALAKTQNDLEIANEVYKEVQARVIAEAERAFQAHAQHMEQEARTGVYERRDISDIADREAPPLTEYERKRLELTPVRDAVEFWAPDATDADRLHIIEELQKTPRGIAVLEELQRQFGHYEREMAPFRDEPQYIQMLEEAKELSDTDFDLLGTSKLLQATTVDELKGAQKLIRGMMREVRKVHGRQENVSWVDGPSAKLKAWINTQKEEKELERAQANYDIVRRKAVAEARHTYAQHRNREEQRIRKKYFDMNNNEYQSIKRKINEGENDAVLRQLLLEQPGDVPTDVDPIPNQPNEPMKQEAPDQDTYPDAEQQGDPIVANLDSLEAIIHDLENGVPFTSPLTIAGMNGIDKEIVKSLKRALTNLNNSPDREDMRKKALQAINKVREAHLGKKNI